MEIGFRVSLAAAIQHNVWVVTSKRFPRFVRPSKAARKRDESMCKPSTSGVDAEGINLFTISLLLRPVAAKGREACARVRACRARGFGAREPVIMFTVSRMIVTPRPLVRQ